MLISAKWFGYLTLEGEKKTIIVFVHQLTKMNSDVNWPCLCGWWHFVTWLWLLAQHPLQQMEKPRHSLMSIPILPVDKIETSEHWV